MYFHDLRKNMLNYEMLAVIANDQKKHGNHIQ